MKVVLLNGSPNIKGCTFTGLDIIQKKLKENDVESEIFHVGTKPIIGCIGCRDCKKTGKCIFNTDLVNTVAEKINNADGVILGSPVHFASATGAATSFFDRLFYSIGKDKLKLKFGASVVSCRRGGASSTFDQLNKYFTISQMPVVSSRYWNSIHGNTPEEIYKDEEGICTLEMLANNMAYLIKCKKFSGIEIPKDPEIKMTNFIR